MESDATHYELYDWTCRVQEELDDLKASFPDYVRVDRNRLIASLSCLRVSLEVRYTSPLRKGHPAPPTGRVAQ